MNLRPILLTAFIALISFQFSFSQSGSIDHFDFAYADRNALLADGWDFNALRANGAVRNTETLSGAIVSYDQQLHPGAIRVPSDAGDLWGNMNNTRNSIFRDLPLDWTSVRMLVNSFNPTQNYQQAGLIIYEDDDFYVQLTRTYEYGNQMTLVREVMNSPWIVNSVSESAISNIYYRLDRDPVTEFITAYYSLDGSTWTQVGGAVDQQIEVPRLAIVVGSSPGGFPDAEIAWVEVIRGVISEATMESSSSLITFNTIEGTNPVSQSIELTESQGGSFAWTAASNDTWLNVSPGIGIANDNLSVSVDVSGLSAGTYEGSIIISSPEAVNSPLIVPVNLEVLPLDQPVLNISESLMSFTVLENGSIPAFQSINILNNGNQDVLNWTSSISDSWISMNLLTGNTPTAVSIGVDQTGLAPGSYTGTITINSSGAVNGAQYLQVNLIVEAIPQPILALSQNTMSFVGITNGINPLSQSLNISNTNTTDVIAWNASSDAAWLSTSLESGSTPASILIQIDQEGLQAGSYDGTITISAPSASNGFELIDVNLLVNPEGTRRYSFNYTDRNSLIADGWTYNAIQSNGSVRNTETSTGAIVSYNQLVHPGAIRIPADQGDLWRTQNNTRNSLFRSLPNDWTRIMMLLESFDPLQNYQQAGLLVYDNDDNYVQLTRTYENGNQMTLVREVMDSPWIVSSVSESATSNMYFRLDRNPESLLITAFYSIDGTTWQQVGGNVDQDFDNPKLAIVIGSSPGGFPNADIAWAEVIAGESTGPSIITSTNELSFSTIEETNPFNQFIVISEGEGPDGPYTWNASSNPEATWMSITPGSGNSTDSIEVAIDATGLATGTYNGTITISSAEALNSPQIVNVGITVLAGNQATLNVVPQNLAFSCMENGPNPAAQALTLSNIGNQDVINWTASSDVSWVTVTPLSGVSPGVLSVQVNQIGLTPGSYSGLITIASPDAANENQLVPISLQVDAAPSPVLAISSSNLGFSGTIDGLAIDGRQISITNSTTTDILNWDVAIDVPWLTMSITEGTTPANALVQVNQAGLAEGAYSGNITISSPEASNEFEVVNVSLLVNPEGMLHIDLDYPDRGSLLSDGWDFLAVTSTGGTRNTEQTVGAVVSYDQSAHPGAIRVPVDQGDLWGTANNTRNTIFRDLPSTWTSVRLLIQNFNPTQDYQYAGLAVYQDDNNYVQINRAYEFGNQILLSHEIGGSASSQGSIGETATQNIYLQLERDHFTETISSSYSLDGINWIAVGSGVNVLINNPKLALITGNSPAGYPTVDFEWVEVESGVVDELRVYPNNLVFNSIEGHSTNENRALHITTTLDQNIVWTQTSDVPWLSGNTPGGNTDAVLEVSVNTTGLAAGLHYGNIILESTQSVTPTTIIPVTLIVNPNVGVTAATWFGGRSGAMSVSVDDGMASGYDELLANGFSGTFVSNGNTPPSYFTSMYNGGMELGAHLYSHICEFWTDDELRYQEIEQNIEGISNNTPQSAADMISMVWPCGVTNFREQAVASEYFLASRGYNFNQLEDATPVNFMNIKSFNSYDDFVMPPPTTDFISLVDSAIHTGKWFNLVLHFTTYDFGAIAYAHEMEDSVWVSSLGGVTKYIMQRNRFLLNNYSFISDTISFNVSRLAMPASIYREFETAFGAQDLTTIQVDVDDVSVIEQVLVSGQAYPYETRSVNGNTLLFMDILLEADIEKTVQIIYQDETLPRYYVNPVSLSFNAAEGENPQPQILDFTTNGMGSLSWTTSFENTPSWISVSPASGTESDNQITVSVNTAGLTEGSYNEVITFSSLGAANSPQTVNVNLLLDSANVPTLAVASSSINFNAAEFGSAPASQNVAILNSETADVLSWTSDADVSWISLSQATGVTPGSVDIGIDHSGLTPGLYSGTVTISSPEASNLTQTINVGLRVNPEGLIHYDFDYPDRASFFAGGWDFIARTAGGLDRDTEQSTGALVSYDQANHPGVLRIPVDEGDLWGSSNNTRNSIFRDLPVDWTRVDLLISSFAPTQSYQQAGLLIYDGDDNYVQLTRIFASNDLMTFAREEQGSAWIISSVEESATSNLYYRFDRDISSGTLSAFYSVDGNSWTQIGTGIVHPMVDPRIGIVTGTSPGGLPNADIAWIEVTSQIVNEFSLDTGNLSYNTLEGTSPADQQIVLATSGERALAWTATVENTSAWLSINPVTGDGSGTITVSVNSSTLPVGNYYDTITFNSPQASNSPQSVPVSLIVNQAALPTLNLSAQNLGFTVVEGDTAPSGQQILLSNSSTADVITWNSFVDVPWITVSPTSEQSPATLTISVDNTGLAAGNYSGNVTFSSPEAINSPQIVAVSFVVNPAGTQRFNFTYSDRAAMLADGWSFIASAANGNDRNTEQLTGGVVSYDQVVHPGVIRIPVDQGDLWAATNNSRNSLFRDLPSTWTSVRMMVANFNPTQSYQQGGLLVYDNDDSYIQLTRIFANSNMMTFVNETFGSASIVASVPEASVSNLHYRLDRDQLTDAITAFYSQDGENWTQVGSSVIHSFVNPQLAIFAGTSDEGFPNFDIAWAEVTAAAEPPVPSVLAVTPTNLIYSAPENGTAPAIQHISISNSATSDMINWSLSENISWLTPSIIIGSSPATVSLSVDQSGLVAGSYQGTLTVSSPEASNGSILVNVSLTVNAGGTLHLDFDYQDRTELLADGWSFMAETASGAQRNTEQSAGATVSYDQMLHPGILRIPVDQGDLWGGSNNSRNSLFRDLPADWVSIRLMVAAFSPTQSYQQAGLLVYNNDDNYVQITRIYAYADLMTFAREYMGSPWIEASVSEFAITNLHYRLDRDPDTETISAFYSLDGSNWIQVGNNIVQEIENPRLAIFVGSSPGGLPNADLAWVEIQADTSNLKSLRFGASDKQSSIADTDEIEDEGNIFYQNYPNPFSEFTWIEFDLIEDARFSIDMYNTYGQKVQEIAGNEFRSGNHKIKLNTEGYPSGPYFIVYKSGAFTETITVFIAD